MTIIYSNKIIATGKDVETFGKDMVILFGENAPAALKDYCYTVLPAQTKLPVKKGHILCINSDEFKILKVGEVAEKNLNGLGHLTINFTGSDAECLPGSIVVEKKDHPPIKIGTAIKILAL